MAAPGSDVTCTCIVKPKGPGPGIREKWPRATLLRNILGRLLAIQLLALGACYAYAANAFHLSPKLKTALPLALRRPVDDPQIPIRGGGAPLARRRVETAVRTGCRHLRRRPDITVMP